MPYSFFILVDTTADVEAVTSALTDCFLLYIQISQIRTFYPSIHPELSPLHTHTMSLEMVHAQTNHLRLLGIQNFNQNNGCVKAARRASESAVFW